jgi:methionyl-tRNA formyltransferase
VRLAFFGTPSDAVPPLRALVGAGHEVALVVTQPDRRRARAGGPEPSPVKAAASELGLAVRTPGRAREVVDDVAARGIDLGVVVAFGQILPPALLAAARHGFVNVHFSLLPRWRGAAPVERAILAGDAETGVWLMEMEEGLDTGGCYAEARTAIGADETAGELRARLVALGTDLLVEHLPAVPERRPRPQVGEPVYAPKLQPEEFVLDPTRPAVELVRVVRAGNPRPGAHTVLDGKRLKVWRAHAEPDAAAGAAGGPAGLGAEVRPGALATVDGLLVLDEVQPEGRRAMPTAAWLAGRRRAP